MRLSILLQNRKLLFLLPIAVIVILSACSLNGYDFTTDTSELTEAKQDASSIPVTISIPNTVIAGARSVGTTAIESLSLSVKRTEGNEVLVRKFPEYSSEQGEFVLSTELPVNTDITLEAVGYDSSGDINAYGIRNMRISENEQTTVAISMVHFQPVQLPIVKLTEIRRPPAASANGIFNLIISGYVLESEWPEDPYGNTVGSLNLDFTADVNGSNYMLGTEQLNYDNLSGGRVSFTDVTLSVPADSTAEAVVNLKSELSPGGVYSEQLNIPQMASIDSFSAEADINGQTLNLNWTNPEAAWFDGVAVVYSDTAVPQSVSDGALLYSGVLESYTHTGLVNGSVIHYTIFPYAEENGIRAYGPGASVSAVPVDGVPPAAVSSLSVSENNGDLTLSWVNPPGGFDEVRVLRRAGAWPTSAEDSSAVIVYSGLSTSCADSLSTSNTYYYSVYTIDASGNCSQPVNKSVVYYAGSSNNAVWGYNYGSLTTSDSVSVSSSSKYADVWVFTLTEYTRVTIGMNGYYGSTSFDTYLYLYRGSTPAYSSRIAYNDDSGYDGYGLNSRIIIDLAPGIYSIEASHYGSWRTGDYRLELAR